MPPFRSDNDLHRWRLWLGFAVPVTSLCLAALGEFGVPFNYTPLATLPAVVLYVGLGVGDRRRRRAGKRFSSYDPDDLSR